MLGDAAGDDAAVMSEVRINVERDAVIGHPAAHAYADRGDLVLASTGPGDPDADPAVAAFALHIEARKGADHPLLEPVDMASDVAPAPVKIEHDIANALARPVIGVATAAAGAMHRQVVRV